jgi:hypothetical protein
VDLVNLLEQPIVFDQEERIVLARGVVLDLDRGYRIWDHSVDLVVLDPFDPEDPFLGVWRFRESESLVLRDSYLVIHRRCRSERLFVLDPVREEGTLGHPFEDHIVRFDGSRVGGRISVAEEVHLEDRNSRSVWGTYCFVKVVLDRMEDADLVVTVSLDRDLDHTSVEEEVVYPLAIWGLPLVEVVLPLHFPSPYSEAGLFYHHTDLVVVSVEEVHCDPNSLDRLVESIYFAQEEVLPY